MKKAMVVGAGQMGGGIAQVMAAAGIKTYLNDVSMEIVESRLQFIDKLLEKDVSRGKIDENTKGSIMANLIPSNQLEDAADCDIVIEAILEKMEIKSSVFQKLDSVCKPDCILASNTSSLPITEIAAVTQRPEKVIGMHFMNPVPVMKLVEIIRGIATSDETYQQIKSLTLDLQKVPVEVRDVPGFVSNRVLQMMINEAVYCLYEGVASVEDIDTVMKLGMNHPMGPLQLADFIGLDTVLSIMEVMYEGYGDCKYRPCPLLRQYVKAGWLGKKAGKGFYNYK
ncbi:3-hydroxyacyl-CoA dehydrogenase family protein [Frisingicoccus sp.]|uniref:3-hydroxyacyl-CoA dehydrogenase family protein n=1 Tax=Frisingicoccus sp. TaxID=1918627 RepID=UPI0015BDA675|nr:3-hydroxybutyryl-CoA dehydrogenase [Frisingicoccus sp.]MEE0752991.1 3-hydroxybutyryl-CoA dehydrogenase [Frisingicoccus sp.]